MKNFTTNGTTNTGSTGTTGSKTHTNVGTGSPYTTGSLYKNCDELFGTSSPLTSKRSNASIAVSKALLTYALYCDGKRMVQSIIHGNAYTTRDEVLGVSMSFLPAELAAKWRNTVKRDITSGATVTKEDILSVWRGFIMDTVYQGDDSIIEKFTNPVFTSDKNSTC